MKIETRRTNTVYFEELNAGDPFWDNDHELLMKIHNNSSMDNAVFLYRGGLCCFDDDDLVTPAEVKIVDA